MLRALSMFALAPVAGWLAFAPGAEPTTPEPVECFGQIGDFVWNDLNADGIQDSGEPGIPGVVILLTDRNGDPVSAEITDSNGIYCFTGLCAGTYDVQVDESTLPAGFLPTMTDVGPDDGLDSEAQPRRITLDTDSKIKKKIDFGYTLALGCRLTGGRSPRCSEDAAGNGWSTGGQIGAPTALQPQPCGEWTHHQNGGPLGRFTFHAGTRSAPDMTEIDLVICSDPGNCEPASNPAPVKQMNFSGVGSFLNIQSGPLLENPSINTQRQGGTPTLHVFDAYVIDLGEPGGQPGNQPGVGPECPPDGFEGGVGICTCPDFYRITIRETTDPMSPVIYEVSGYLSSGNYQMHDPIDGRTCE